MRNSHRKISIVALSGAMLIGGVLGSCVSAYASSISNSHWIEELNIVDGSSALAYLSRPSNEKKYGYRVLQYNLEGKKYSGYKYVSGIYGKFRNQSEFFNYILRNRRRIPPGEYNAEIENLSFVFKFD